MPPAYLSHLTGASGTIYAPLISPQDQGPPGTQSLPPPLTDGVAAILLLHCLNGL